MELPKDLKDEIKQYCELNDITNVDEFIVKMIKSGFTSNKYGSTPWEKPAEIKEVEKIVEVIKEVEKEVIKEVIKEVEVVIEKEIFVTDDEASEILRNEICELEEKLSVLQVQLDDDEDNINKHLVKENELNVKITTLNRNISDLNENIKQLEIELETEKNKPKQEEDDIYGEKKGFFGSNTSDLWKRKKK